MSTATAYLEIIDFIAGGTTPESVIRFHPSREAQTRVAELLASASAPAPLGSAFRLGRRSCQASLENRSSDHSAIAVQSGRTH